MAEVQGGELVMPFPTTPIIDTFNRADSPLDTSLACSDGINSWFEGKINGGVDTNCNIASNRLTSIATGDSFIVASFGPDVEVYSSWPVLPTSYIFHAVRIQDVNTATWDGYGLLHDIASSQWQLRRYTNGVSTVIATSSVAISAGDKVGLSVIGTTLSGYRYTAGSWNQTPIVTTTDATYALAGKIGFEFDDTTGRMDDFGGGTYIAPAAASGPVLQTPLRRRRMTSW